jgi:thioredoxin reductase (NADPH)
MGSSAAVPLARDPLGALRRLEVFARLSDAELAALNGAAAWQHLAPGASMPRGSRSEEHYWFVVAGQIALTLDRSRPAPVVEGQRTFFKNRKDAEVDHLAFFTANDFYSDGSLFGAADEQGTRVECVALIESDVAGFPRSLLARTMRANGAWAREMNERNAALRAHYQHHKNPDVHVAQEFFLRYGYSFATTLKVIDLERCISCNACEDSCAARHGTARLDRRGPVLGQLAFPISCRTCADHRCVAACGFDAIAYTDAAEVRVDKAKCVGCTACQAACPNDVITMVKVPYGLEDFPSPMPDTNPSGETNVPGLYLVGEASGDALIKMAINSGRRAMEDVARSLSQPKSGDVADVVIVGSGPSGLSAALTAKEKQLSYVLLEKGTIASTIRNYPRHKVVMAEPAHIPLFGDLWLRDTTKEELIEKWNEIITRTGLEVRCNEGVEKIEKVGELFDVRTANGSYRARRVVLATGNRGAPRRLGVPGEREPRVSYVLTEPEEFAGRHVLVVGGGDSAVEAAMSLADVPGTKITLSYRRDSFGRIKARNKSRLDEMTASGKIEVILKSKVIRLEERAVALDVEGGEPRTIENDVIFALLGAEPPTKMFEAAGINILQPGSEGMAKLAKSRGERYYASKCDHCTGHDDQACITACPTEAIFEVKPEALFAAVGDATKRGVFSAEPFLEGFGGTARKTVLERIAPIAAMFAVIATAAIGIECFLRALFPEASALYAWQKLRGVAPEVVFSSSAGLGFHLGITGTTLMVLTALYPLHTRIALFRRLAKTPLWLATHIFAGIAGPFLVTYHTKLKLDRWPAIAFWSMWAVVLSGLIGRFVYTWIRKSGGLAELERRTLARSKRTAKLLPAAEHVATVWKKLHVGITVVLFAITLAHIVFAMLFKAS